MPRPKLQRIIKGRIISAQSDIAQFDHLDDFEKVYDVIRKRTLFN